MSTESVRARLDAGVDTYCYVCNEELSNEAQNDLSALCTDLAAALTVIEAAKDLANRDGRKDDVCSDCGLGGHLAPCPWTQLDDALSVWEALS